MTHRDRAGDAAGHRAGRRQAVGDAGHRQGLPTPPPIPPLPVRPRDRRRFPKAFGQERVARRCPGIASPTGRRPKAPAHKTWGNRRPGRAGEPAPGESVWASENLDDAPHRPRLSFYPADRPRGKTPQNWLPDSSMSRTRFRWAQNWANRGVRGTGCATSGFFKEETNPSLDLPM